MVLFNVLLINQRYLLYSYTFTYQIGRPFTAKIYGHLKRKCLRNIFVKTKNLTLYLFFVYAIYLLNKTAHDLSLKN